MYNLKQFVVIFSKEMGNHQDSIFSIGTDHLQSYVYIEFREFIRLTAIVIIFIYL
jgi:hypothetical protein